MGGSDEEATHGNTAVAPPRASPVVHPLAVQRRFYADEPERQNKPESAPLVLPARGVMQRRASASVEPVHPAPRADVAIVRVQSTRPRPTATLGVAQPLPDTTSNRPAPQRNKSGYIPVHAAAGSYKSGGNGAGATCCLQADAASARVTTPAQASSPLAFFSSRPAASPASLSPSPSSVIQSTPGTRTLAPHQRERLERESNDPESVWQLLTAGEGVARADGTLHGHALVRASYLLDQYALDPVGFRLPQSGDPIPQEAILTSEAAYLGRASHQRGPEPCHAPLTQCTAAYTVPPLTCSLSAT